MRRIFVTGATGFVGRAVIHALRAEGYGVRCLVRRGSEGHLRGQEAIERVEGDVLARETLERGIAGCDTVIHLVGIIREQPATHATFERVHVQGTVNVLEAAAATGRSPLPAHERPRHAGRGPLALPPHQVGRGRGGALQPDPVDDLPALDHLRPRRRIREHCWPR